ncbi:MAG: alpha/beta hydrolase, partial [Mycobacterium sp.]
MTAMRRLGRVLAAMTAAVTVLSPAAAATPQSPQDPSYFTAPVWSSCADFVDDVSRLPTAQCGTVAVPVDYANPQGAAAQLAVIKVPATGPRLGVLVVNPGGPGASAVDAVAGMGAALAG